MRTDTSTSAVRETPTNAEFTQALGRAVGRPAFVPVPASAIRIGAGPLAPELLGSVNLVPQALVDAGFEFRDRDVTDVLAVGPRRPALTSAPEIQRQWRRWSAVPSVAP